MPIFSGIAALVGSVGTWFAGLGAITQAFVQIGAGLVFNKLSAALAGKPEQLKEPGIVGELQQGADVSRKFFAGRRAIPGSLAYHNEWGADNEFYTRITALSDLPITGLVSIWVDGKHYQLDRDNPHADFGWPIIGLDETRTESRRIELGTNVDRGTTIYGTEEVEVTEALGWVRFFDGTQNETASFVVNDVATEERPWDATDIGTGVANAITTFKIDRDVFQGLPELLFVGDGIAMENPATETTGHSENPIVMARTILNGLSYGGQWFYGPESGSRFDDVELISEIAKCDAPVPGGDAMSEAERIDAFGGAAVPARYRASIEISLDRQPADILEDLLSACNGRASEVGTRYRLQVGDPGNPVAAITDDDILSSEGQTFAPFFPLAETVNAITATYPSPKDGWQQQDAPPLYRSDLEDLDGNRRLPSGVSLSAVPFPEQVQRLMASALAEARRARRHSFVLPSEFWRLEPGDFFTFTSTRNGYIDKLFRVDGVSDLPNGDLAVDVTEVDPADYSWQASSDFRPVASGSLSGVLKKPSAVLGWDVQAVAVEGEEDGVERPALALLWDAPAASAHSGLEYEVRAVATGATVDDGQARDVSRGIKIVASGILGNTSYEARASYVRLGKRDWTDWVAVRTLDIRLGERDVGDAIWERIERESQDDADRLWTGFDRAINELAAFSIDEVSTAIIEQARVDGEIKRVEDTFGLEIENANAEITTIKEVAISDQAALAQLTTEVTASFNGVDAQITTIETAAASDAQALATLETTLNATLGAIQADVSSIQTANATDEQALASLETTLTANLAAANANIQTVSNAVAQTDVSLASVNATLTSSYNQLNGFVNTQVYTKSETDSQISSQINTVNSTVGSLSTTITQVSSAVDGVEGRYGVRINSNNAITGFGLLSGAGFSSFLVEAASFRFRNPNASGGYDTPFQVTGGKTYAKDLIVQTLQIDNNAVMVPVGQTANINSVGNNSWAERQWLNLTLDQPGRIMVNWSGSQGYSGVAQTLFGLVINGALKIQRGGLDGEDMPAFSWVSPGNYSAGTHRISIYWKGWNGNVTLVQGTLAVFGVKR